VRRACGIGKLAVVINTQAKAIMGPNTSMKKAQLADATLNDPRWPIVKARSPEADGNFYYGVRTTGVYCRPSCAARPARPENVSFYETREEAEQAGLRPCKRCRPDRPALAEQYAARVTRACRIIEGAENIPALGVLAREAGMSTYHFHRVFKKVTGLTPRQYAAAQREKKVRNELEGGVAIRK
jgi:AraC family transcriptional regulator, regulatory protein of adaptative response / methylated-DNA-[protein]-cysteine methyltransferase